MLCITSRFAAQSVKFPVRLCNTSSTTTLPDRRRHRCVQWNYCCDDDCEYRTLVVFALQADRQLKEGGRGKEASCAFFLVLSFLTPASPLSFTHIHVFLTTSVFLNFSLFFFSLPQSTTRDNRTEPVLRFMLAGLLTGAHRTSLSQQFLLHFLRAVTSKK